jgi:hypothetical protein
MTLISETDAATQLGISREILRNLRKDLPLKQGQDWRYGAGGRVYLTPEGIQTVTGHLGTPEARQQAIGDADDSSPAKDAPPALPRSCELQEAEEQDAEVIAIPKQRKVLVVRSEAGEQIRCMCRSNENFVIGMKIRIRRPGPGLMWYLEGRCPRRRGVW